MIKGNPSISTENGVLSVGAGYSRLVELNSTLDFLADMTAFFETGEFSGVELNWGGLSLLLRLLTAEYHSVASEVEKLEWDLKEAQAQAGKK